VSEANAVAGRLAGEHKGDKGVRGLAPVADYPRYRFGFVMQQVLGHITAYQHFRRYVDGDPEVAAAWAEVTYYDPDGWIERLPLVPAGPKGVLRAALQVRAGLAAGPFDAVLFNSQALCLWVRGYMRRVPSAIVTDVTPRQFDAMAEHYNHQPPRVASPLTAYKHAVNVDVYRAARLVLPWSHWTKASLMRDYGVPEEKIVVVPPGVDIEVWSPPKPDVRTASLTASGGRPRILFVGGDFERKGGSLLLEWFRQRGSGRCELHLVTRTPPPAERTVGLEGLHVHTGLEASDPRLRQLYAESHLFVLPTRADCFGVAAIEAMATGLPVLTTDVGGVPDIVAEGETGYLIPPDDERVLAARLETLLADAARREEMGRRARQRVVGRFDAHKNAQRQLSLLKRLAAGQPPHDGAPLEVATLAEHDRDAYTSPVARSQSSQVRTNLPSRPPSLGGKGEPEGAADGRRGGLGMPFPLHVGLTPRSPR
jgi:glycosyltransferase involved in cell wall biosynthesis